MAVIAVFGFVVAPDFFFFARAVVFVDVVASAVEDDTRLECRGR